MGDTLTAVWEQVTALLQAGVSVIPVRDREDNGKPPKTPYAQWKQYQQRIIAAQELWSEMERHNTSAIAMICGKVSGNLEAIDIDVKNWPGIDARYFEAIRDMYPVLWENLRIHSTPSGGFHILYRIDRPGPGNQKLATASHSTQAGIETRGEGGYIVAPPSLGYQIYKNRPVPLLTWEQREALINLAKSFNEKVKIIPAPQLEKNKIDFYEQDPFSAFNLSSAAECILELYGWRRESTRNTHYRYWTRPGKNSGISASFHVEHRLYYIFTTGTGLVAERAYTPSSILLELQFAGDRRACYQWLVEQGYGRIKPKVELRLIRSRVLSGEELPGNVSTTAKELFTKEKDRLCSTYPAGTYWVQDDIDDVVKINRERLYTVASHLGFRHYNGAVVQIDGYIVRNVTARQFYDTLKAYCVEEEEDFLEAIRNAFEAFIQKAGEFTITRIQLLEEERLLLSRRQVAYIGYQNVLYRITPQCRELLTYEQVLTRYPGALIWDQQIIKRDFVPLPDNYDITQSLYHKFLQLAIGISDYLWLCLGYLAHDYKDETMGYIFALVEQSEDPKQGGGTGKNLFCNLLSHITTVKIVAGSQVQLNEKLLQSWNYEKLMVISDIPKHFNWSFLKEPSMGHATKKNLFRDEIVIPPHKMCKFLVLTNYSYDNVDGGLKRRIRPIEFTPFFTKSGGVDIHFNKMFPFDWDATEWAAYDHLMHQAIQKYLASDGKLPLTTLSPTGWLKQFDQTYHFATRGFIQEYWEYWTRTGFITNDAFKQAYDQYCHANGIHPRYRLTSFKMNQALKDWGDHHQIFVGIDVTQRINSIPARGKSFVPLVAAPF